MIDLVHVALSHVGVAGLAGLWAAKVGLGAVGLRWWRLRRKRLKG